MKSHHRHCDHVMSSVRAKCACVIWWHSQSGTLTQGRGLAPFINDIFKSISTLDPLPTCPPLSTLHTTYRVQNLSILQPPLLQTSSVHGPFSKFIRIFCSPVWPRPVVDVHVRLEVARRRERLLADLALVRLLLQREIINFNRLREPVPENASVYYILSIPT